MQILRTATGYRLSRGGGEVVVQTDGSIDITPLDDELVTITGDLTVTEEFVGVTGVFSGILSVDDTTDTTSTITGSIHTDGGVGIAKALWVGTTSRLVGNVTVDAAILAAGDDQGAIGASGVGFSDFFLSSGAVINFNAGDVTLTHGSNVLTMTGGVFSQDDVTEATSSVTGSIHTDGGLGVALNVIIDGKVGIGEDTPVVPLHIKHATQPQIALENSAQGLNEKIWDFVSIGSQFYGRVVNDVYGWALSWLVVNRTATNVNQVELRAGTNGVVL
ncbi:hypothetical protein LCGC14_2026270, partial [marine sediment metagenome]